MELFFSDIVSEQIRIGKEYYRRKSEKYSKRTISVVYEALDRAYPEITTQQKEELFYRSVYDYWNYGAKIEEVLCYDFFKKSHEEKKKYITLQSRFYFLDLLNKDDEKTVLTDKYKTYQRIAPMYKREMAYIKGRRDIEIFNSFVKRHPVFVVKPIDLEQGHGVYKVDVVDYSSTEDLLLDILHKNETIRKKYVDTVQDDFIVEELIIQNSFMDAINPYSVTSVRCITVNTNNTIRVFSTSLTVGNDKKFVSNAAQGGLKILIDIESGRLGRYGFTEYREKFEYHPLTGVQFEGMVLPQWSEMIEMSLSCAKAFNKVGYIGWDFAFSQKGWCVIEGNSDGELVGAQLTAEKGLKEEMEKFIDCQPNTNWWGERYNY